MAASSLLSLFGLRRLLSTITPQGQPTALTDVDTSSPCTFTRSHKSQLSHP
jgi:hypothetical protein